MKGADLRRGKRFANVFCFIVDLAAFNDGGEFEGSLKDTYQQSLK